MAAQTDASVDNLHALKRKQLQALCKKHGLKANGRTEELIELLVECRQGGGGGGGGSSGLADGAEESDGASSDSEDEQSDDAEEEQGKVFKDVPVTDDEPLEMEAPESMTFVNRELFPHMAEKVTAAMEARTEALATKKRSKAAGRQDGAADGSVPSTPARSKRATKALSFEQAHAKIFDNDDSIVNHWAAKKTPGAATPRSKRTIGDDGVLGSSKRPRIEPLFSSPEVIGPRMQSPVAQKKPAKAMTAKARRTAAATASAPGVASGSKTVAAGIRARPADVSGLSSTKLFTATGSSNRAAEGIEDSAPIAGAAAECHEAPARVSETSKHKVSEALAKPAELVKPAEPAKPVKPTEPAGPMKQTPAAKSAEPTPVQAKSTESVALDVPAGTQAKVAATGTASERGAASGSPMQTNSSSTKLAADTQSKLARPTLIPKSKKAPGAGSSGQLPKLQPKTQPKAQPKADPKAQPKTQPKDKTCGTTGVPRPAALGVKQGSEAPTLSADAAKRQPVSHKPASYRHVESKLKSYINAAPPSAPKPAPSEKPATSKTNAANQSQVKSAMPKPASSAGAAPSKRQQGKQDGDTSVPGYMRATKATVIRSQAQSQPKTAKSGGPAAATGKGGAKARFAPYSRPVPAKPSAAK
ncbi:hypothetical protein LPJ61_004406 [Coemansia biformis]|uniref:SAP domain-containing protein n=1 Tax=Coemansia biformis TaxID=1286918 RepID=A0A9W8CUQ1_9FUNG|nr:hypothetical protein LPJ61_004406 [Coemansia biformis]